MRQLTSHSRLLTSIHILGIAACLASGDDSVIDCWRVAESKSTGSASGTTTVFGGNCASCSEEGSCVLSEDASGNRIGLEEVDTM